MRALTWYRREERCPVCGGPAWLCQAPDAENAFRANPPVRCHLSTEIQRAQDEYLAGAHQPQEQALVWSARHA